MDAQMGQCGDMLAGAGRFGRTVVQRFLDKAQSRAAHGYIGCLWHANVGDEAVFCGLKRLRPDVAWLPSIPSAMGLAPWPSLWLDGPTFLESVVLGGGTLINVGRYRCWAEELLRLGQTVWCCGTGVGSAGWSQEADPDIKAWRGVLNEFVGIAVRGPRSKERLEALGVSRVEVCGDLALALVLDEPRLPVDPPALALNVSVPVSDEEPVNMECAIDALINVAARWRKRGGRILPLAMDRADIAPLAHLCRQIDMDPRCILSGLDPFEIIDALASCSALIGVRLHSAVLATCAGVPPILLGYRDKCLDFMLSMGLGDAHIDLAEIDAASSENRIEHLLCNPPLSRIEIVDRAQRWAEAQRAYVSRVIGVGRGKAGKPPGAPGAGWARRR
ncbi:MAG: polysaccharide pyruvyl transferase family protein [Planctomycetota bacterium]